MKKPKNFDKLNKIKISDLPIAKFFPTVTTVTNEAVDITHIQIYNASPKTKISNTDIYQYSSTIVLISEGHISTNRDELVIKINWVNQLAAAWNQPMGTYYTTNRGLARMTPHTDKKFFPNQVVTMEAFIQMVILPLAIKAIEKTAWRLTP